MLFNHPDLDTVQRGRAIRYFEISLQPITKISGSHKLIIPLIGSCVNNYFDFLGGLQNPLDLKLLGNATFTSFVNGTPSASKTLREA